MNQKDVHGNSPLLMAVFQGQKKVTELCRLMFEGDAPIDIEGEDLMSERGLLESRKGFEKVVELLLGHRDLLVNQGNNAGTTPLLMAAATGRKRVLRKLLQHKDIKVNQANNDGKIPLQMAVLRGHDKVRNTLLDKTWGQIMKENPTCIICMDRGTNVILVPCGHPNTCGPCAIDWDKQDKGCPMDRRQIDEILILTHDEE